MTRQPAMIYEFKSRATGSVVMTEPVGKQVLEIIGKSPDARGIITVDQIPTAIAALEKAVGEERMRQAERTQHAGEGGAAFGARRPDPHEEEPADDAASDGHARVLLAQRVFPLVEMMRTAHAAGKDITWGV